MNRVKGEGVPDFVLLETISEDAMMENISTRYKADQIYVYYFLLLILQDLYRTCSCIDKSLQKTEHL